MGESESTCRHPYENWKAVTEADFVTLFIKTWFAFVSTLRELYADKAKPYYEASGDSPFLTAYKDEFADKMLFLCKDFSDVKEALRATYKSGMEIISAKYPRFLVEDFYNVNWSFSNKVVEEYSSPGGYAGKLSLTLKCVSKELFKVSLHCTDKKLIEKAKIQFLLADRKISYKDILDRFILKLEGDPKSVGEDELVVFFYEHVFNSIATLLVDSIADIMCTFPDKGYTQVRQVFTIILNFCSRAIASLRKTFMDSMIGAEHKLLAQVPCQGFLQNSGALTAAVEQSAYRWFIGFVYRLRNALFHEIIDPLDTMWQHLFKNAYLVLKQIVDVNITRLNTMSRLREASFSTYKDAFISEPPPEIPIDQATTFGDDSVVMQSYNQDGAKVHIVSTIKCKGKSYLVDCDVKWDKDLKHSKVKHVQIKEQGQADATT